jgi:hypothetical protein
MGKMTGRAANQKKHDMPSGSAALPAFPDPRSLPEITQTLNNVTALEHSISFGQACKR